MTATIPEGWENHQLSKSLRKMAENVDLPDEVSQVIFPSEEAARLFAPLMDEDITVLAHRDGQLVIFSREGQVRTTIPDGSQHEDAVDLRIGW